MQTGATPQQSKSSHKQALKARFNEATVNRVFSADVLGNYESWGGCPSLAMNAAPLALDRYATIVLSTAKIDLDQFDFRLGLRSLALSEL
jgi:hypothetical protein